MVAKNRPRRSASGCGSWARAKVGVALGLVRDRSESFGYEESPKCAFMERRGGCKATYSTNFGMKF